MHFALPVPFIALQKERPRGCGRNKTNYEIVFTVSAHATPAAKAPRCCRACSSG